jgi:hypothetical protein
MKQVALFLFLALATVLILCAPLTAAQGRRVGSGPPDLRGVFQSIPDGTTLPGGLRNGGSPASIALLPEAARLAKSMDLKQDPWKMCQPVGPFRMMAGEQTRIELVQVSAMIVMLFEDLSHGMMRPIYLTRNHPANLEPTWLGDSTGRWESDTLVVDTIGFNDSTWLNDEGAQHSDALHLVERIRPVLAGQYLEYRMTAEDPKTLAKPYGYTRYYKKLDTEIMDDPCQEDL